MDGIPDTIPGIAPIKKAATLAAASTWIGLQKDATRSEESVSPYRTWGSRVAQSARDGSVAGILLGCCGFAGTGLLPTARCLYAPL